MGFVSVAYHPEIAGVVNSDPIIPAASVNTIQANSVMVFLNIVTTY